MTETRGKDFNFFQEIAVSGGSFSTDPDVQMRFRGPRSIMFVCRSGTDIEYSFNGTTTHGKLDNGDKFNFGLRNEDKIWFKGTGEVQVHAWRV